LRDAPDRIVNLAKIPAYLAGKTVVSEKKKKSLGKSLENWLKNSLKYIK
jgi:hypothetical protein